MKRYFSEKIIFELLDNEQFLQWVIAPTPELHDYWNRRMEKDRILRINIMTLREILKKMKIDEPVPGPEDKMLIWEKIEKEILAKEKKGGRIRPLWIKLISTAAIAVIIAGCFWLLFTEMSPGYEIDYGLLAIDDEELMKSGNINLVLSDNQTIDIESDSLTIAYTQKGTIKIGEEQVIETSDTPQFNRLIVPYGKTTSIILSDGTKVWMNSGSKLIYPQVFDKTKREVFLTGEAYMDVVKISKTPFIIKTDHMDVNVLGTQLNISAYDDDQSQSVVLVKGAVEIKSKELKGGIKLLPDQMLTFEKTTSDILVQKVDVTNHVSWIHGYLLVNSESLSSVLYKLGRHYNVTFIFNESELKNIRVSGKLDLEVNISEVLDYIALTAPISYQIKETTINIQLLK